MTNRDTQWTDASVRKLLPALDDTSCDAWFDHPYIHNFGVRFRRDTTDKPWGKGTYTVRFFKGGRYRRMSIAKVGQFGLAEVEERARGILKDATDPAKDPAIERRKAKDAHSEVFKTFVPDYVAHMRLQNLNDDYISRSEDYLSSEYCPDLQDLPIKLIEQSHIADTLRDILNEDPDDPVPIAMTRARSALSMYFKWLRREGKVSNNPVSGTASYISEEGDRVLTPEELVIVWNAASPDWEFGRIIRLLILTAARKTQIGSLLKRMVERTPVNQIVLPKKKSLRSRRNVANLGKSTKRKKATSKNKLEFRIPLSRQALALLDMQGDRENSSYVFGEGGEGGFSGWSNGMEALNKRIGNKFFELRGLDPEDEEAQAEVHWTFHDLRRTFATLVTKNCYVAASVRVPPHVADAAINHKPKLQIASDVAGVYNHNDYLEERIPVMQIWADYVEALVRPKLKVVENEPA
jgi:integrase